MATPTTTAGCARSIPATTRRRPGVYRLTFDTQRYFESLDVEAFYPEVVVVFETLAGETHYHVPLLLAPFGSPPIGEPDGREVLRLMTMTSHAAVREQTLASCTPVMRPARQPVHTFIIGGDALYARLRRSAPAPTRSRRSTGTGRRRRRFADAIGMPPADPAFASTVSRAGARQARSASRSRTCASISKTATARAPDAEEDGHAESAARAVAAGMKATTLPPFIGIRIKPMSQELHARGLRTLDIFVSTLVAVGQAAARTTSRSRSAR